MWTLENSRGDEAAKIRWEVVPYFHGRILDLGCGQYKTFPHWIGVDNGSMWGKLSVDAPIEDALKLDLFASSSCDGVFSSHLLEHIPYELVPAALTEWCRVIRPGGHLMLYVPDENDYPKVGEFGANPDHKWNVNYDRVIDAMERVERGWNLIEFQRRNQDDEYSLLFIFKLAGKRHAFSWKLPPDPRKKAAVIRYGAFGDMIQASSIFPGLKAQGYHVTLYCSDRGYEVVKHDPNVDRFVIQGKDEIPQQFLSQFWDYTRTKYDKWINLCESVEGTLLPPAGSMAHGWPDAVRAKYFDRNYLEFTHEIAEIPPPYQAQFYSTQDERVWARAQCNRFGSKNVLWSLSGSSVHKVWPHLDEVVKRILYSYPDTHIVTVGDEMSQILEVGLEHPRIHCCSGKWTIRESMSFAQQADLIIGTETGLLNAAGLMITPKIVTLSHSSEEMLTKHWRNVTALKQKSGCPKFPCRQLHYDWTYCMKHPSGEASVCQYNISADAMWEAIIGVLGQPERLVA